MSQQRIEEELNDLRTQVADLRERVVGLEGAPLAGPEPGVPEAVAPLHSVGRAAATFTGLAVICFSLVGALVLRVGTQQGWVGPSLGVGLGLGYCGLLLIGPVALCRRAFAVAHGGSMQACGVLLAPSIVLETFHRQELLSAGGAVGILVAFGIVGGLAGASQGRRAVAWLGLLGGMLGLAGLGLILDAAWLRASGQLGLLACALLVAHARAWKILRALAILVSGATLGVAVFVTAQRHGVPGSTAWFLLAAAGGAWLLVAIDHQARSARMSTGEAVWLPLGSLWIAGLLVFHSGLVGAGIVCGVGLGMLAGAQVRLRSADRAGPGTIGLALSGWWGAAFGASLLDPTGLGLVAVALAGLVAARSAGSDLLALAAQLSALGGAVRFLVSTVGPEPTGSGIWFWPVALVLAGALVIHARLAEGRARTQAGAWLAPLSLVGAVGVACAAASAGLLVLVGPGEVYRVGTSALLALAAGGCLWFGARPGGWRGLVGLGLVGVGLLAIKVTLVDLFVLGGASLLASFVALGGAFGMTSLALRRRAAVAASQGDGPDPAEAG